MSLYHLVYQREVVRIRFIWYNPTSDNYLQLPVRDHLLDISCIY